jgi:hypothetical protein
MAFSQACVNLARYSVREDGECVIQRGVEMYVRSAFVIEGTLVVDGRLVVKEEL